MRIEDLNWMDVEKYLESEDRLMLVTGATEQHGYLSLLTDIKIPLALADAASQATGVLVAPPLNFGASPYFLAYPGTLSLRIQHLDGGGGGHCPLGVRTWLPAHPGAQRPRRQLAGARRVCMKSTMSCRTCGSIGTTGGCRTRWRPWRCKHNLKPTHANWLEAFPFTVVGDMPEGKQDAAQGPERDPGCEERRARCTETARSADPIARAMR